MKRAHIRMTIFCVALGVLCSPPSTFAEGSAVAQKPAQADAQAAAKQKPAKVDGQNAPKQEPAKPNSQSAPKQKAPLVAPADDAIPKRPEFERYAGMVDRSPFAVATAPTEVAGPPAWSKDLFIANAAHTPEVDLVTISSVSDKNLKEYVTTEKTNEHGYGIANIEWAENPGGTKVTISKDGQFATIGFNEAVMGSSPQIQQPGQPPQIPASMPAGMKPQPGVAQTALPAPHVRGPIQRTRPIPGLNTPVPQPNKAFQPNAAPVEPPDSE